ncbi:MAG: glycosyl hydrolase 2 galactose-binding domain-containing protein [Actinomycetota bacterium]
MTWDLRVAERPRPGAAPVSEHSEFEPVARAAPVSWSTVDPGAAPSGSGRITVDLNGAWQQWADESGDPAFPAAGARAASGVPGEEAEWRRVVVPENFGFDSELSRQFAPVWYRRRFGYTATDDARGRARLRFAAVDYLADVWLNGEHLGHHEGYFAPFGFDVTGRLAKDNELVVAVQDPLEDLDPAAVFFQHRKRVIKGTLKYHDSRPGGLPGRMVGPLAPGEDPWVWTPEWGQSMTTAGITGAVTLERTHDVTLDAVFATPLDDPGGMQLALVVTNHTDELRPLTAHLEIGGERAAVAFDAPPGSGRVDAVAGLDALARWEPTGSAGAPTTHEVAVAVADGEHVLDRRRARFGVRTARIVTGDDGRARELEVNGRSVFVKAVNYIPWQHFAEVGRSFYDRDMRLIAAAHGNSIGVHAHVQSADCYDAADDAGILVFQDFPLQWFYDSGTETNPGFVDTACRQIAEMGYLLHNHPSLVYYACHNEPARMFGNVTGVRGDDGPETDLGEAHLDAALEAALRTVDDSRHVHRASGIGDDVHNYAGSLAGGSLYRVREQPAWFVSEYGFWTIGPQAHKFGDQGWPPDPAQLREWVSRLSFIGSTCAFAGLPSRYESLDAWREATEEYGAALAKYQTEWFRARRGEPFMGYRWHFWSDWWGYAGGGLVDVERVPKRAYEAFRDASRPLLVIALQDTSVVAPGDVTLPLIVVNDRAGATDVAIDWDIAESMSAVIAPDPDGARIGLPMPADEDALVAVPRSHGAVVAHGTCNAAAAPESATTVGEIVVTIAAGEARTVLLRWIDPELGAQQSFAHLHCPAEGERHPPGLSLAGTGAG